MGAVTDKETGERHECRWTPVRACVEVFMYRGLQYSGCSLEDHGQKGWCSVDQKFQGNWRNCHPTCKNADGATFVEQNTTGLSLDSLEEPRRLATEPTQSDRFLVSFRQGSVPYKIDEDLVQGLVRRSAFRGIEDGQEAKLGKASIIGFRLHKDGQEPTADEDGMIPVLPEEKFEFNGKETFKVKVKIPLKLTSPTSKLPLAVIVAAIAALGITSLVVGIYRVSKSSVQVAPYMSVESTENRAQE